jgi:hypothetical protein
MPDHFPGLKVRGWHSSFPRTESPGLALIISPDENPGLALIISPDGKSGVGTTPRNRKSAASKTSYHRALAKRRFHGKRLHKIR